MVSSSEDGQLWHRSVNACLAPLYSVEGTHVVTVEGVFLASRWHICAVLQHALSVLKIQAFIQQGVARQSLFVERSVNRPSIH